MRPHPSGAGPPLQLLTLNAQLPLSSVSVLLAPASEGERVADCSGQRKLPGAGQTLDGPSESGQVAGELRFYKPNLFKSRSLVGCGQNNAIS